MTWGKVDLLAWGWEMDWLEIIIAYYHWFKNMRCLRFNPKYHKCCLSRYGRCYSIGKAEIVMTHITCSPTSPSSALFLPSSKIRGSYPDLRAPNYPIFPSFSETPPIFPSLCLAFNPIQPKAPCYFSIGIFHLSKLFSGKFFLRIRINKASLLPLLFPIKLVLGICRYLIDRVILIINPKDPPGLGSWCHLLFHIFQLSFPFPKLQLMFLILELCSVSFFLFE